jgi:acetyl esterase/lipase
VVFWIHGGGWQAGDKSQVKGEADLFVERGFVFVSTNYRLYPKVEMLTIFQDVAKSIGWVYKNIAAARRRSESHLRRGHSAGAQLAALMCIDDRYLKAEGVPFSALKGCFPVDGDTYDVPAIIEVAETRARAHGEPLPSKNGHRQKFGNDPEKHKDYSAVTHVAKGKGIPPFLILYVADHPDTSAQARRLARVLKESEVRRPLFGGKETNHSKLNDNLGTPDDPATKALDAFLNGIMKK